MILYDACETKVTVSCQKKEKKKVLTKKKEKKKKRSLYNDK